MCVLTPTSYRICQAPGRKTIGNHQFDCLSAYQPLISYQASIRAFDVSLQMRKPKPLDHGYVIYVYLNHTTAECFILYLNYMSHHVKLFYKQLDDSSECYGEEPLPEEIPREVAQQCISREIARLTPIDCSEETGKRMLLIRGTI